MSLGTFFVLWYYWWYSWVFYLWIMKFIDNFKKKHPDLFAYLPSESVFPHDLFLARTILRFIPMSITPNRVTLFRILATPVVVALILYGFYLSGVIAFVLVAFTDAIDGSMARTRNQVTKFGMLFDPLADKLLIGIMVLLLVFQNFHYLLGVALLGIEILFIMTALIAKTRFNTVRAANVWGKIKMILQVFAVFLTLIALVFHTPYILSLAAWVFGLAIGFALISLFSHGV